MVPAVIPALDALICAPNRASAKASAIWLRQALAVPRKRIRASFFIVIRLILYHNVSLSHKLFHKTAPDSPRVLESLAIL